MVGSEIQERIFAPKQRVRVGAAFAFAAAEIQARLQAGEAPRQDGFFGEDPGRSHGAELLGGVLLTAADAWEERKVSIWAGCTRRSYSMRRLMLVKRTTFCGSLAG
jgi:hypothetical protein